MNYKLKEWVRKWYINNVPIHCDVEYAFGREFQPYISKFGQHEAIQVGKDWLLSQAESDPELKAALVEDEL